MAESIVTDRLSFLNSQAPVRATSASPVPALNLDEGAFSSRVSMLEFGVWEQPEGMDSDTDLQVLQTIHTKAQDHLRDILGAIKQVRDDDDPSLNEAGRLKVLAKVVEPKLSAFAGQVETEFRRVDEAIEHERAEVFKEIRPTDANDIAIQADIRQHVARLTDDKRNAMVNPISVRSLDMATLQALALAPAYLSKLLPSQHERVVQALAEKTSPGRMARINALRDGRDRAFKAITTLDKYANQLIDFKKARALAEREAKRG